MQQSTRNGVPSHSRKAALSSTSQLSSDENEGCALLENVHNSSKSNPVVTNNNKVVNRDPVMVMGKKDDVNGFNRQTVGPSSRIQGRNCFSAIYNEQTTTNGFSENLMKTRRSLGPNKVYRQIVKLPEPPPEPLWSRHRLPSPPPDILERIIVCRAPRKIFCNILEKPICPPPIIRCQFVHEPIKPYPVINRVVYVPPSKYSSIATAQAHVPHHLPNYPGDLTPSIYNPYFFFPSQPTIQGSYHPHQTQRSLSPNAISAGFTVAAKENSRIAMNDKGGHAMPSECHHVNCNQSYRDWWFMNSPTARAYYQCSLAQCAPYVAQYHSPADEAPQWHRGSQHDQGYCNHSMAPLDVHVPKADLECRQPDGNCYRGYEDSTNHHSHYLPHVMNGQRPNMFHDCMSPANAWTIQNNNSTRFPQCSCSLDQQRMDKSVDGGYSMHHVAARNHLKCDASTPDSCIPEMLYRQMFYGARNAGTVKPQHFLSNHESSPVGHFNEASTPNNMCSFPPLSYSCPSTCSNGSALASPCAPQCPYINSPRTMTGLGPSWAKSQMGRRSSMNTFTGAQANDQNSSRWCPNSCSGSAGDNIFASPCSNYSLAGTCPGNSPSGDNNSPCGHGLPLQPHCNITDQRCPYSCCCPT